MELLQLEHFLAVVDEGSFTRAAERVYRTQSAISQSIKRLEETVGTPLLVRDASAPCPTPSGRVLADYARRLLRVRDDAMRSLDDLRHLVAGQVSLAAHESAAVYLLPGPLKAFWRTHPEIKVVIHRSSLSEIPRLVLDREVDVGFVKDPVVTRELKCVQIHADEMVLIGAPSGRLAGRSRLEVRDLASERLILHHGCRTTTQQILQLFEQHACRCKVAAELWSFENVKQFVREDAGIAIVPRICVRQELLDGALVELPLVDLEIPRPTCMIVGDERYLSDATRALIDIVSQFNWDASMASVTHSHSMAHLSERAHAWPLADD